MLTIKKQFMHLMNHLLAMLTGPLTPPGALRGMSFNGLNYLLLIMLSFFSAVHLCFGTVTIKNEQATTLPYKMILILGTLSIGLLTIIFYISNLIFAAYSVALSCILDSAILSLQYDKYFLRNPAEAFL